MNQGDRSMVLGAVSGLFLVGFAFLAINRPPAHVLIRTLFDLGSAKDSYGVEALDKAQVQKIRDKLVPGQIKLVVPPDCMSCSKNSLAAWPKFDSGGRSVVFLTDDLATFEELTKKMGKTAILESKQKITELFAWSRPRQYVLNEHGLVLTAQTGEPNLDRVNGFDAN